MLPSSTPESKQSSNLLLFISMSIAGMIMLFITIVICITVYKLYKMIYKERHLPAANTMELSQNECYGLATVGNVAYNATIENPPSPV